MIDELLKPLSDHILDCLDDSLTNDEFSSDEELVAHFVNEYGLTLAQATKAVSYRYLYFINIFEYKHTPLRKGLDGYVTIRFALN